MSIVQDFGKKGAREGWVSVGGIAPQYGLRSALKQKSQFFVILKGIGPETYKCLQDVHGEPDYQRDRRARTRTYLKQLRSTSVDYVEDIPGQHMLFIGGTQNLPLVYGETRQGSHRWDLLRDANESYRL